MRPTLPFDVPKEGQAKAPLLSLKDISLAHLTELAQLGVASLKIEGRMRRPEYVAAVCTAFRTAIDEKRNLTREELAELATVFQGRVYRRYLQAT